VLSSGGQATLLTLPGSFGADRILTSVVSATCLLAALIRRYPYTQGFLKVIAH